MATRYIRKDGDDVLRKVCKEVDVINDKIRTLLKDMADTMYKADGVGLAAPQVGILKRIVVIDAGEALIELINPVIVKEAGEQVEVEGCLSLPEVFGEVKRPATVTVEALNAKGEKFSVTGEGLLARALCHEIDHLNGILFKDKVIRFIDKDELQRSEEVE